MIGRLKKVPVSEMYETGGSDFAAWLQQNIDVLNDAVNLQLSGVQDEPSASVADVVARDGAGETVVIENQVEESADGALGRLIMGMASTHARTGIWIVAESRQGHVSAVSWLNESSSAAFYLLQVEAYRIDDSAPAPLMKLVAGPEDASTESGSLPVAEVVTLVPSEEETDVMGDTVAGQERYISEELVVGEEPEEETAETVTATEVVEEEDELAEGDSTGPLTQQFWTGLLEKAEEQTRIHADAQPNREGVLGASAGLAGLDYNYVLRDHDASVELYIDRGEGREGETETIFNALQATQDAIEYNFGGPLDWQEDAGPSGAHRVESRLQTGGLLDEEHWPEIQDHMVNAMIRLERAMRPHIARLQV